MKKIEAYIKERRLDEVAGLLHAIDGLTGVSVHEIKGFGRGRGNDDPEAELNGTFSWVPHVKIEVFCLDELQDQVIDAIVKGAQTGLRGDGKIFVSSIEGAVRISTSERNEKAV